MRWWPKGGTPRPFLIIKRRSGQSLILSKRVSTSRLNSHGPETSPTRFRSLLKWCGNSLTLLMAGLTTESPWPSRDDTTRRQYNFGRHSNGNRIMPLRKPRWTAPSNWQIASERLNDQFSGVDVRNDSVRYLSLIHIS